MRIYISNVDLTSRTGPNTFALRLVKELIRRGNRISGHSENYDAYLAFINTDMTPKKDIPLIHRLDGIWFKPTDFIEKNKQIKKTYETADHIIWQSEFDMNMSQFHWGKKNGTVINNGIDIQKVQATNTEILDLRSKFDKIFVCSANWRRHKRLKENIELFERFKNAYPELSCALFVLGDKPDYTSKTCRDIYYTNSIGHDLCLQLFSISDAMIHLAYMDHCPNTVVESISQDCPVICTTSGGTREIVKENGIIIQETKDFEFALHDYAVPPSLDLDSNILMRKIFDLVSSKKKLLNNHLDIRRVVDKYICVLEQKNEK